MLIPLIVGVSSSDLTGTYFQICGLIPPTTVVLSYKNPRRDLELRYFKKEKKTESITVCDTLFFPGKKDLTPCDDRRLLSVFCFHQKAPKREKRRDLDSQIHHLRQVFGPPKHISLTTSGGMYDWMFWGCLNSPLVYLILKHWENNFVTNESFFCDVYL